MEDEEVGATRRGREDPGGGVHAAAGIRVATLDEKEISFALLFFVSKTG